MRSQLYLLASGLFMQPESSRLHQLQALLEEVLANATNEPWQASLAAFKPYLNYDDNLESEYSRLFILALPQIPAQPFGSYWLENPPRLLGDSTVAIQTMMAEYGIEVAENSGLLPDHLVAELEFMAYLISLEEKTWQTQWQLLEQHLARWTPLFTSALRMAHPHHFYRLASNYLDKLIVWDRQQLSSLSKPNAS